MDLGQPADGLLTSLIARGSTAKGVKPETRGVITMGVLTCEGLWSETTLFIHSPATPPVMVGPTPETGDDSKDHRLAAMPQNGYR